MVGWGRGVVGWGQVSRKLVSSLVDGSMVRSSSSKSVFVCVALGSVILFVLFRCRVVRYVACCVVQCGVTWHGRVWLDVGFNHKLQQ